MSKQFKLFDVSSVCFNSYLTDRRNPPRPLHLRQCDFNDNYDFGIIFVDIFFDSIDSIVHCIGAPLYNTTDILEFNNILLKRSVNVHQNCILRHIAYDYPKISIRYMDRTNHYLLNYKMMLKPKILQFNNYGNLNFNIINQNESEILRNKRVVLLKNKDNQMHWIKDFCDYYKKIHKADAILIYDSSELYASKSLLNYLKDKVDISIIIVRWPVPFGPTAIDGSAWDSDYSLYLMYEHARYRFLTYSKSVLHVDIDELVVSNKNLSIFEYTEKLNKTVFFDGRWVVNNLKSDKYSYKDMHYLYKLGSKDRAVIKWCTIPRQIENIQWRVHDIYNFVDNKIINLELDDNFETRHFIAITSGWRSQMRLKATTEDLTKFEDCIILRKVFNVMQWN
ncbi:hypothetical protein ELQ12_06575 [Campylobacter sp. US25a]|uniref:hypothetical protein n=1 Tax=Campylobacter sp. US25a TaxID=2498119 RepID=UPI001067FA2A|nr:hypothetical protein [Campylobacter sp. US25a]TEY07361.1 hypothetical protein ELQ12_06575 [Campylobacter sp. US25a]